MAKIALQKVRITGLRSHYDILIKELQRKGVVHIKENFEFSEESTLPLKTSLVDDFDLAKVEFAINYLTPFAPKKGKMESILTGGKLIMSEKEAKERFANFEPKLAGIVEECEVLQERAVKAENEIVANKKKLKRIEDFAGFRGQVGEDLNTSTTKTVIGKVATSQKKQLLEQIALKTNLVDIDIFNSNKRETFFRLTYFMTVASEIEAILNERGVSVVDLATEFPEFEGKNPAKIFEILQKVVFDYEKELVDGELRKKELAKNIDELKLAYDFYAWRKDEDEVKKNVFSSEYLFAFEAWMEKSKCSSLEHWIKQVFVGEVVLEKVEKDENEKVPALLKNRAGVNSFQLITEMYGAPKEEDIDPTPGIAPFFVLFFGICLSDTGYGLILFLVASFFLLFGKFSKEARVSLWMVFLLGVSAFAGGVLLGGHFGMTPAQAPAFMTTLNEAGELVFRGQILDPMKGTGAMTFLLATFAIGMFQLLFGLVMEFIKHWSKKNYVAAFADTAAWFFFMTCLLGWALADKVGLPKETMKMLMLGFMGVLILTQGREKTHKNPIISVIMKLIFGVLGLYGIMDYVSNTLSYSRLMALGLATGIIGSSMNMTAAVLGDMLPGAGGIIIMVLFLIFGHSINFGLSAMGAFIHSMRLQFIEFFGVFYKGGAPSFKAFAREKKYLLFRS